MTSEQRSKAKAVNFGLMYGQSSFGLSTQLKISRNEAGDYIAAYFKKFQGVKAFLDGLKEEAEKTGFASTLMGRRRPLPGIRSSNRTLKSMAERMAINTPIQGTAADLIKKAMIAIDQRLLRQNLRGRMLLQVHDELILEVPEEELDTIELLVKEEMENVASLNVPLIVDLASGGHWASLK